MIISILIQFLSFNIYEFLKKCLTRASLPMMHKIYGIMIELVGNENEYTRIKGLCYFDIKCISAQNFLVGKLAKSLIMHQYILHKVVLFRF